MLNLAIDIGNSFTKTGIFNDNELLQTNRHNELSSIIIGQLLNEYQISNTIISSVKHVTGGWPDILKRATRLVYFTRQMASGIYNHYKSQETLGLDRLAGIAGAAHTYPDANNLVIDGGTCITYDWVDSAGNYFGGSISPGLTMRYKALNYFTAALPLINADTDFKDNFGADTSTSMISGIQNGLKFELTGFIESYVKPGFMANIILTGGDSNFFDTLLKNSIFAPYIKIEPVLVLKGLNAALQQY